ncbi:MAG: UDP-glucuronic acid decarboxylase family protein [Bdellovibrionota bacterium]|nr:SDR family oxidoreductase [Pseudomonadota bacterium]MDY6090211.1 UDP-glucuronic acid decarboxylase family protein [Bdellovibrionota bacterium]
MARIAITGGAGFIGSHLTDLLLSLGHEVVVVDNLFTGRKTNFEHNLDNKNFEFIRHDVVFPLYLEVDEVYHLACPASPEHYQYNAIKTIKTNVLGTINMLGLAKRSKASFLLASTSEIYGDPLEHPQKETYWGNVNTVGPRSCYDEGKRIAETLAMNYRVQNNVNTKIVRIFNTYGPRMLFNDGRVVSNFIVQALKGEDITIYGDGTQTRSFCFVEDLIQGFVKMIAKKDFFGPCNLGNPTELNMKELATKIITLTNSKSKIVYRPLPQDDPKRRKPDITLAKEKLNWEPKISVDEGLKRTIEDFDKRLRENL